MNFLLSQIIPSLKILNQLRDINLFENWLSEYKYDIDIQELFSGYRFLVSCCLNSFVDGIVYDSILGLKTDLPFDRAVSNSIPIHEIENSCEKTIFLKNVKPYIKNIQKAKTYDELAVNITIFENEISSIFNQIIEKRIILNSNTINEETIFKYLLIDFTYLYLMQVENNGPLANFMTLLSAKLTNEMRLQEYFEGYKYGVQFIWFTLLGKDLFKKTSLFLLNNANTWRDYKYIKINPNDEFSFMNREFILEEQTCFDSYFYRVRDEIIERYKYSLLNQDYYYEFKLNNYNRKQIFADLIYTTRIKYKPNFSLYEKIQYNLLWYPVEIINTRRYQMHFGVPSFNVMLVGNITLNDSKESELDSIYVVKFKHPQLTDNKKNNYSFGILIDAKSSAGHFSNGWIIYQDICNDYSGFASSELNSIEKLIKKNEQKIILKEVEISINDFTKAMKNYVSKDDSNYIIQQEKINELNIKLQYARSYLFELFIYSVFCKNTYYKNNFDIKINVDKNKNNEKDIVLFEKIGNKVIIIECKINSNNQTVEELSKQLKNKIEDYTKFDTFIELWFWKELDPRDFKKIRNVENNIDKTIKIISVSNPKQIDILRNIDMDNMRSIMN